MLYFYIATALVYSQCNVSLPFTFTFSPITSLGVKPNCKKSVTNYFKTLLGMRENYPDERLFTQLKSIGVQKILRKTKFPETTEKKTNQFEPISQIYSKSFFSIGNEEVVIEKSKSNNGTKPANQSIAALNAPVKWIADILQKAIVQYLELHQDEYMQHNQSDVEQITNAYAQKAAIQILEKLAKKTPMKQDYIVNSLNENELLNELKNLKYYSIENIARHLSFEESLDLPLVAMRPEYISDESYITRSDENGGFFASLDEFNHLQDMEKLRIPIYETGQWLQLPENINGGEEYVVPRNSGSLMEQLFAQAIQLAASSAGRDSTENHAENILDDVKLARFFNGQFVGTLIDSVVNHVDLKFGKNISLVMESPMINMGFALCESSSVSHRMDPSNVAIDSCAVATLLRNFLSCREELYPKVNCSQLESYDSFWKPCDKMDQFPGHFDLDISIDAENPLLDAVQGNIDRWLFNAASILYRYARWDSACGVPVDEIQFLPGWKALGTSQMDFRNIMSLDHGVRHATPNAVLLQNNKNKCKFVIVARGTQNMVDWLLDFQTKQINLTVNHNYLGKAHAGFANIAAPTAAYFAKMINCQTNEVCRAEVVEVTVSGHSLGAGVSVIMSLFLTEWLPEVKISSVVFATPNSLDKVATAILKERVNLRSWVNEFDAVPMMPCVIPEGQLRCPATTGDKSGGRDFYSSIPNQIKIKLDDLGQLIPNFLISTFGEIRFDTEKNEANMDDFKVPGPAKINEAHTCAYKCWLDSQYCFGGINATKRACSHCT